MRPVGGGFGGVARTAAVTGLTVVGTALAVKGTIDDAEEGDYVGAGLNAARNSSAVWNRSAGALASALVHTLPHHSGKSGR